MWKATGIRKTGDQCRTRWTKVDDPSIRKGSWSVQEDDLLATAVKQRTTGDSPPPWVAVSSALRKCKGVRNDRCDAEHNKYARHNTVSNGETKICRAVTPICTLVNITIRFLHGACASTPIAEVA